MNDKKYIFSFLGGAICTTIIFAVIYLTTITGSYRELEDKYKAARTEIARIGDITTREREITRAEGDILARERIIASREREILDRERQIDNRIRSIYKDLGELHTGTANIFEEIDSLIQYVKRMEQVLGTLGNY